VNTSAIAGIHCATLQHYCLYVEGIPKLCHKHSMTRWKISAVYGFRVDPVCQWSYLRNSWLLVVLDHYNQHRLMHQNCWQHHQAVQMLKLINIGWTEKTHCHCIQSVIRYFEVWTCRKIHCEKWKKHPVLTAPGNTSENALIKATYLYRKTLCVKPASLLIDKLW